MPTPRSPRGYRQKGNNGERRCLLALERDGFEVRNGAGGESAADLYIFWPDGRLFAEAECKARKSPPYDLKLREKVKIAKRAARCRELGWQYLIYYIVDADATRASIYLVGGLKQSNTRKGLSLELYKQGFLPLTVAKGPPPVEVAGAPSTPAKNPEEHE